MAAFLRESFLFSLFFFFWQTTTTLGAIAVSVADVYRIKVMFPEEASGDIFGAITVRPRPGITDQTLPDVLYNVTRPDSKIINNNESLFLTGPTQPIQALRSIYIDFKLFVKGSIEREDRVFCGGTLVWELNETSINKPILNAAPLFCETTILVDYIVYFPFSVVAVVEVTLVKGGNETNAEVYGDLTARTDSDFPDERPLFHKKRSEYIDVYPGNVIPLSRSIVILPLTSPDTPLVLLDGSVTKTRHYLSPQSLLVSAKLFARNLLSHDVIANATDVEFHPQLYGTSEQNITGKDGKILVKVTWTLIEI